MINDISVGVILPAYNAMATIDRAINSVLQQTHKNIILYIIEDCSTDGTREKLASYQGYSNIVILYNEVNLGVAGSRNRGLDYNQQQVVAYIDSDDEWLPEKLQQQLAQYVLNEERPCITGYSFISETTKIVSYHSDSLTKTKFLKKDFRICLSSLLHKKNKSRFQSVGHEDFLFIYQLYHDHSEMTVINLPLVNYYVTDGSLSSNKLRAAVWHYKLLAEELKLTKRQRLYYFIFYAKNAISFRSK